MVNELAFLPKVEALKNIELVYYGKHTIIYTRIKTGLQGERLIELRKWTLIAASFVFIRTGALV